MIYRTCCWSECYCGGGGGGDTTADKYCPAGTYWNLSAGTAYRRRLSCARSAAAAVLGGGNLVERRAGCKAGELK